MIAGRGIPIDAVVNDFAAGAAELLSPARDPDHWGIVEGQGSLLYPSYAAVTPDLVHGTQPDALALYHDLSQVTTEALLGYPIPSVSACITRYVEAAQRTNANVRCIGIFVNSSGLSPATYAQGRAAIQVEPLLPCVDPIREGAGALVAALDVAYCTPELPV